MEQVNSNLGSKTTSNPIIEKCQEVCLSFICWRSSMIHKMLLKDPYKAVEVLKHEQDQEFKDVRKKPLIKNTGRGEVLLKIGKNRACTNNKAVSFGKLIENQI